MLYIYVCVCMCTRVCVSKVTYVRGRQGTRVSCWVLFKDSKILPWADLKDGEMFWKVDNAREHNYRQWICVCVHVSMLVRETLNKNNNPGLPWWHSDWESTCQCRGHGFEPWSGKIPHVEQLSSWATTTEPALWSLGATATEARVPQLLKPICLEPVLRNKRSHRNEKPTHRNEEYPLLTATREGLRAATKTQLSQK